MIRRDNFIVVMLAAALAMADLPAVAEPNWKPVKPIRIVVAFTAGGAGDVIARTIAEPMSKALGQPVIVENKPGASGVIGQEAVNSAPPDGYTLFVGIADTQAINPLVIPNYRIDVAAMTPVAPVITASLVLCTSTAWGAKNLREAVNMARTSTSVSYAHWGLGSNGHIGMEMLKNKANLPNLVGVQFGGVAPGLQALMGNHVQMMILPAVTAFAVLDKIDCHAIVSSKRSEFSPTIPSIFELGYEIVSDSYMGIFGPPKMPKYIVDTLHKVVSESVDNADTRGRFHALGLTPHLTATSQEYGQWVQKDRERWMAMVRTSGIGKAGAN